MRYNTKLIPKIKAYKIKKNAAFLKIVDKCTKLKINEQFSVLSVEHQTENPFKLNFPNTDLKTLVDIIQKLFDF